MTKVLIVTNSLTGGGAERSMNLLANLMHKNGFDVYMMPINFGEPDEIELKCHVLPSIRVWKSGILKSASSVLKFRRIVQSIEPQNIILNCELPELFAFFSPPRIKIISVEHTSKPWKRRKLLGLIVRLHLRVRQTQWVLVSDHLKKRRIYGRDVRVIPNLISPRKEIKILNQPTKLQRLVFIGRLSPEKNPFMFLEISKVSDVASNFIGDGFLSSALKVEVAKANLQVEFSGRLNNPWEGISQGDLLVVTSNYEGDGLVILEALKMGVPILLRNIPDLRRFNFPDRYYFSSVEQASKIILENRNNIENLLVDRKIAEKILILRAPPVILEQWSDLINAN